MGAFLVVQAVPMPIYGGLFGSASCPLAHIWGPFWQCKLSPCRLQTCLLTYVPPPVVLDQSHVVLRSPDQWARFHDESSIFTQNARNSTLPSELQLTKSLCVFEDSIKPILHTRHPETSTQPQQADHPCAAITTAVAKKAREFIASHQTQYTFAAVEKIQMANTRLKSWNIVVVLWDKKLHCISQGVSARCSVKHTYEMESC